MQAEKAAQKGFGRFDAALRWAQTEGRSVVLTLASQVVAFPDDAQRRVSVIVGGVAAVDTYMVLILAKEPESLAGREVWVSKSSIVLAEIQR